jgi:hypothetical protein
MYALLSPSGILLMWLLSVLMMILKYDYAGLEVALVFGDSCNLD